MLILFICIIIAAMFMCVFKVSSKCSRQEEKELRKKEKVKQRKNTEWVCIYNWETECYEKACCDCGRTCKKRCKGDCKTCGGYKEI
jgi:hypothetical protein